MSNQLHVGQELCIDGQTYRVAANPDASWIPYGQEGRAAFVYQLHDKSDRQWALKVFKPRFRDPSLVTTAEGLAELATLPGLGVCRRTVLCPQHHGMLLKETPALTYAVLMPWMAGPTWFEVLWDRAPLTAPQSLILARSLVTNLMAMEQRRVAHCDLSSSNLLLPALAEPSQATGVAFVDVEGLYGPHLSRPPELLLGTPGYAHPSLSDTSWLAEADRFAGAVLLAEMLGWSVPPVREAAWQESYFEPVEMQQETERYTCLLTALQSQWGSEVGRLFSRAWHSATLKDCPTFGDWFVALPEEAEARYQERPIDAKSPEVQFTEGATRAVGIQALLEEAAHLEETEEWESALAIYQELLTQVPSESALAEEVQEIITRLKSQIEVDDKTIHRRVATLFEVAIEMYQQQQWTATQALLTEVLQAMPGYARGDQSARTLLAEVEARLNKKPPQRALSGEKQTLIKQTLSLLRRAPQYFLWMIPLLVLLVVGGWLISNPISSESTGDGLLEPTGSGILFTSDRNGKSEVYRLTDKGVVQRVTHTEGSKESWEPVKASSSAILFTSNRSGKREIYRLTREGKTQRVTHTPGNHESWEPTMASSGAILFTSNRSGKREIYRLTREGKTQRVTHTPGNYESWKPAMASSGAILFTSNRSGKREIYRLTHEGKTQRVTHTPDNYESWEPMIVSNGAILFTSNRDSEQEVYRLTREGKIQQVTHTSGNYESWVD